MARTHLWDMHTVHWGKIGITILLLSWGITQASAQYKSGRSINYDDYRSKDYYFGISLGFNSSQHQVFHSEEFINNPKIFLAQGASNPGFNVHGIINYKFGEYFDFRVLPGISFATRSLQFGENQSVDIESIFAEIPLHIRYKSAPYRDKRAFVIAGVSYAYDVASNSETRQADDFIKISPQEFRVEAGFGMQFFFQYFILSPEIKFSYGLNNTLLYNNQVPEASVMEKLVPRVVTLSFHFEG